MRWVWAVLSTTAGLASFVGSAPAGDSIFDVEHARALALSGGPVSENNAWYLDRYGALTGSGDWRLRVVPTFGYDVEPIRRPYRQKAKRSSFE
jgi:hypothetical protein